MLGLVLDEPNEADQREDVNGMTFLIDRQVAVRLEHYLPLQVDYDDRYWLGLRVRASRRSARC